MELSDDMIGKNIFLRNCDKIIGCFYKHTIKYRDLYKIGMGDSYLCEICGFAVPNRARVKRRGDRSGSPEVYGLGNILF